MLWTSLWLLLSSVPCVLGNCIFICFQEIFNNFLDCIGNRHNLHVTFLLYRIFIVIFIFFISVVLSLSFHISCIAGLVVMYSSIFILSGKLFISPPILFESLVGYYSLGFQLLFIITLNTPCHALWPEVFLLRSQVTF